MKRPKKPKKNHAFGKWPITLSIFTALFFFTTMILLMVLPEEATIGDLFLGLSLWLTMTLSFITLGLSVYGIAVDSSKKKLDIIALIITSVVFFILTFIMLLGFIVTVVGI